MYTKDLISVIIPAYNAEKDIERCVRSIMEQGDLNFELIVVNDGSKDRTGEILGTLQEQYPGVQVLTQENLGLSMAKNNGLALGRGEFVLLLDSDDYIEANMLSTLRKEQKKHKADLVLCGYIIHRRALIHGHHTTEQEEFTQKVYAKENFFPCGIPIDTLLHYYMKPLLNPNWNKLYKREIIEKNAIRFDTSTNLGEDLCFNLDYLLASESVAVSEQALYHFMCLNAESLSKKYRKDFFDHQLRLFLRMKEFLTAYGKRKRIDPPKHEDLGLLYLHLYTTMVDYMSLTVLQEQLSPKERVQILRHILSDREFALSVRKCLRPLLASESFHTVNLVAKMKKIVLYIMVRMKLAKLLSRAL